MPWYQSFPPADAYVPCAGQWHEIQFHNGELQLPGHPDAEAELVLAALGGDIPECVEVAQAWNHRKTDVGLLMVLPRSAQDRITVSWNDVETFESPQRGAVTLSGGAAMSIPTSLPPNAPPRLRQMRDEALRGRAAGAKRRANPPRRSPPRWPDAPHPLSHAGWILIRTTSPWPCTRVPAGAPSSRPTTRLGWRCRLAGCGKCGLAGSNWQMGSSLSPSTSRAGRRRECSPCANLGRNRSSSLPIAVHTESYEYIRGRGTRSRRCGASPGAALGTPRDRQDIRYPGDG
jgi:hypothetical protein